MGMTVQELINKFMEVDIEGIIAEIRQTKEDMEEYRMHDAKEDIPEFDKVVDECLFGEDKLNLKPFDLEAAKAGKPVCTRDGRKARIICLDSNGGRPIVALVTECDDEEEIPYKYHCDGFYNCQSIPSDNDLMMLPEKKEGWVNVAKEPLGDDEVVLGYIFNSYEDAVRSGKANERYVATVRIEWEG